jgi:Acyclic terpene utilisation family protein AtuA
MTSPLRIANCSGFYGDRHSAAREMVSGGPIDVLTGDYLAELTMAILWKARTKDPDAGYATTFLAQWEEIAATVAERGIKVVVNAGGLNPGGLAAAVRAVADQLGLALRVARVDGDDLLASLPELQAAGEPLAHLDDGRPLASQPLPPVAANAYLGCFGIAEALAAGADVVVCGRVTDAALTMGPAAWHHGWARDDWDALAGALVAGHVIECGTQATGGNYSFFTEVPGLVAPGFPVAEVAADGSAVVTKHPGHGGQVSVGTVTAQLLYEVAGPRYASPDVTARLDTVRVEQDGPDRVHLSGVRGEPPPPTTKVAVILPGGWRHTVGFLLTGLDVEAKAALVEQALWPRLGGRQRFARSDVRLLPGGRIDPASPEEALSELRVTVMDPDPVKVGRGFSAACVELALASYPGFTLTAPPGRETAYAVYWPTLVANQAVPHRVVHHDGTTSMVPPAPATADTDLDDPAPPGEPGIPGVAAGGESAGQGPTVRAPLGRLAGARSGDKGGNANLGVWAREEAAYAWLRRFLDVERLRLLLPETAGLEVRRYPLPNLLAVNFVIVGLLGDGVASSTRPDPQAKGLGEHLRARLVDLPAELLTAPAPGPPRRAG